MLWTSGHNSLSLCTTASFSALIIFKSPDRIWKMNRAYPAKEWNQLQLVHLGCSLETSSLNVESL